MNKQTASRYGWVFFRDEPALEVELPDGTFRRTPPEVAAHKRWGNDLIERRGPSEQDVLRQIDEWENHALRGALAEIGEADEATVPLPDRVAEPDAYFAALEARSAAAAAATTGE